MLRRRTTWVAAATLATLAIAGVIHLRAANASPIRPLFAAQDSIARPICLDVAAEPSCPDLTFNGKMAGGVLTTTATTGERHTTTIPQGVDAVFFGADAVERYLVLHYDRTSPVKARALRAIIADYRANVSHSCPTCGPACWHKDMPWSEYECFDDKIHAGGVLNGTLTITTTTGDNVALSLPRGADAVFFGKSAVRDFLVLRHDLTDEVTKVLKRAP